MTTERDEICLAHCLRSADRVISQLYNESLAPQGLRITKFSLLRALHLLGSCNATQLREVLVLEQASVSRGLQPLIRDGYVQAAEGEDKRQRMLRLTQDGEALYQQALEPWRQAQERFRRQLGELKSEQLVTLSRRIAALKKDFWLVYNLNSIRSFQIVGMAVLGEPANKPLALRKPMTSSQVS